MVTQKLFEGFFWIAPTRPSPTAAFDNTKVIWHYPQEISSLAKEYKDIPQFCFPDLETLSIERIELSKNEHFVFTLTEGDGTHVYGICLRTFPEGVMRRFDVGRRAKHCLCFISRRPYFSLFKELLLQVHSLTLIDGEPRPHGEYSFYFPSALAFLESAYSTTDLLPGAHIVVPQSVVPTLLRDYHLVIPKHGTLLHKEVSVLPLLELLGVDKFMLILSAALCERRLIFLGDSIPAISSCVMAMAAVLHPFSWQHIFIPVLPSKLLSYVAAPVPFMIGIRRYLLPRLNKEAMEGVLIVDVDSGECTIQGEVVIKDFVGESGTALKQASESLDRVVAKASGVANMILRYSGQKTGEVVTDSGPKDLLVVMLADLRSMLNSKPGSGGIQAVTELIRSAAASSGSRSMEANRDKWVQESERTVRQILLLFYVYLFAEMDECLKAAPAVSPFASQTTNLFDAFQDDSSSTISSNTSRGTAKKGDAFGQGDSRSAFNLALYFQRRTNMGDSKAIMDFLLEFRHSQMFERFCADRIRAIHASKAWSGVIPNAEETDDFSTCCAELKSKGLTATVANVKSIVQSPRVLGLDREGGKVGAGGLVRDSMGSDGLVPDTGTTFYHPTTLLITSQESASAEDAAAFFEQITRDAFGNSELLLKVMRTMTMRVEECRANMKGNSLNRTIGVRVVDLLIHLLLRGPQSIATDALDLIPALRVLIHETSRYYNSVKDIELKLKATYAILLLVDHKLLEQLRFRENMLRRAYPDQGPPKSVVYAKRNLLLVPSRDGTGRRDFRIPDFKKLHIALTKGNTWPPTTNLHGVDLDEYTVSAPEKPPKPSPSQVNLIDLDYYYPTEPVKTVAPPIANLFADDDTFVTPASGSATLDLFKLDSKAPSSVEDKAPAVNPFDPRVKSTFDWDGGGGGWGGTGTKVTDDDPFAAILGPSVGTTASDPFASLLISPPGQTQSSPSSHSINSSVSFSSVHTTSHESLDPFGFPLLQPTKDAGVVKPPKPLPPQKAPR